MKKGRSDRLIVRHPFALGNPGSPMVSARSFFFPLLFLARGMKKGFNNLFFLLITAQGSRWLDNLKTENQSFCLGKSLKVCFAIVCFPWCVCVSRGHLRVRKKVLSASELFRPKTKRDRLDSALLISYLNMEYFLYMWLVHVQIK